MGAARKNNMGRREGEWAVTTDEWRCVCIVCLSIARFEIIICWVESDMGGKPASKETSKLHLQTCSWWTLSLLVSLPCLTYTRHTHTHFNTHLVPFKCTHTVHIVVLLLMLPLSKKDVNVFKCCIKHLRAGKQARAWGTWSKPHRERCHSDRPDRLN